MANDMRIDDLDKSMTKVKNIASDLEKLERRMQGVRFLPRDQKELDQQSIDLGELRSDTTSLVKRITAALHQRKEPKNWRGQLRPPKLRERVYTGDVRENIVIYLVNAALLELEVELLIDRIDANRTWFQQSTNAPDYRSRVRDHTDLFTQTLRDMPASLTALNYHTIASALRSWSDELSVSATDASGWLEPAIPVSRDLRYLANSYHTRWLWKSAIEPRPKRNLPRKKDMRRSKDPQARSVLFARAIFDSGFRLLSGYGLRGRRFIASLIVITELFAMCFYAVNVLAGCQTWWSVHSWVNLVASLAYLVGDGATAPDAHANAACPGTGYMFGLIGVIETGVGYLLLGILVSLLYAVIQRRSIDTSRLVLPPKPRPPSVTNQVAMTQNEVVNVESNTTLEVNTQIDAPPTPPDSDGDPSDPDGDTSP